MSPFLLSAHSDFNRKQVAIVVGVLLITLLLPVMAVSVLGSNTLSFLAHSLSSVDSTADVSTTTVGLYEGPAIAGDTYAWGNCTYWVYALRLNTGDPIPTTWGNAATWAPRAIADGYVVDNTPSPGAIMQTPNSAGGLGHVAYVTAVNSTTGRWTISEMNVKGLDVVDTATYPADRATGYNFIHDKASP
jgi:surface antigen